jgi:hypothetical protein
MRDYEIDRSHTFLSVSRILSLKCTCLSARLGVLHFKRKETEMMNEINYLRGNNLKYARLEGGADLVSPW